MQLKIGFLSTNRKSFCKVNSLFAAKEDVLISVILCNIRTVKHMPSYYLTTQRNQILGLLFNSYFRINGSCGDNESILNVWRIYQILSTVSQKIYLQTIFLCMFYESNASTSTLITYLLK